MFKFKYFFILILLCMVNFFVYNTVDIDFKITPELEFEVEAANNDVIQIFYMTDPSANWGDNNYFQSAEYTGAGAVQKMKFHLPIGVKFLRIDTGNGLCPVSVRNMKIINGTMQESIISGDAEITPQSDIAGFEIDNERQTINVFPSGGDPYFVVFLENVKAAGKNTDSEIYNLIAKLATCAILSVFVTLIGMRIGFVISFIRGLVADKKLIWNLSKNDFKTKYAGSFFGIVWAFVNPVITVLVYWFVFQVGLRATSVGDCPFALWFISGLVPWFFFSDAIMGGTNSLFEYSYLVKKVVFKISVIPIVKIISALFVHLFFIIFTILLFSIYGYIPSVYTLQLVYYSFSLFVLVLGIVYTTCAIVLFFKDLGQIISILLQIGMWMTPIMWSYTIIEEKYRILFKFNPLFYIIEGYRDSLIDHYWFWQRLNYSIYFWIITLGIFGFGAIIFRRLKPHFADVL